MTHRDYAVLLAKSNTDALGFIPSCRYEQAEMNGTIFHQVEGGEWVGFLLVGAFPPGGICHIWQECIEKGARNYGSGRRLVERLVAECRRRYVQEIRLRCADDLPANLFWESCGFAKIATTNGGQRRRRKINTYSMILFPTLFHNDQP